MLLFLSQFHRYQLFLLLYFQTWTAKLQQLLHRSQTRHFTPTYVSVNVAVRTIWQPHMFQARVKSTPCRLHRCDWLQSCDTQPRSHVCTLVLVNWEIVGQEKSELSNLLQQVTVNVAPVWAEQTCRCENLKNIYIFFLLLRLTFLLWNGSQETRLKSSLVIKRVSEEDFSKEYICKLDVATTYPSSVTIRLRPTRKYICSIHQRWKTRFLWWKNKLVSPFSLPAVPPSPPYPQLALSIICTGLIVAVSAFICVKFKIDITLFFRDTLGCHKSKPGADSFFFLILGAACWYLKKKKKNWNFDSCSWIPLSQMERATMPFWCATKPTRRRLSVNLTDSR